jgi:predicted RNA methylase
MTSDHLANAAVANREKRMAQLAALRPIRKQATERAEELRGQIDRAKGIGQRARFTRSMHWVPGFFPTPPAIVARMIDAADLEPGMRVLEPECGKGNIALPVKALGCSVYCIEKIPALVQFCHGEGLVVACADFLEMNPDTLTDRSGALFDRVLMNPPFETRQDEQHIKHAFEFLQPGGRLVAVCTVMTAARMSGWAAERGGYVETLPEGAFKCSERPTGVNTSLLIAHRQ